MLKAKRKAVGHRITAGADKAYDTTPHVAQNNGPAKIGKRRRSSIYLITSVEENKRAIVSSDGGAVSSQPTPSVGTASGPDALQNFPPPANTYANA
jgi:hypothetical protein